MAEVVVASDYLKSWLASWRKMFGGEMKSFRTLQERAKREAVLRLTEQAVAQGFIPPVLDPILGDYQRNIPNARDPEVLVLFTTVVEKLKSHVLSEVPKIMAAVFECTLQMITVNFEDFPEHRIRFFEFIRVSLFYCCICLTFSLQLV